MRRRNALLSVCLLATGPASCKSELEPEPNSAGPLDACGGLGWLVGTWETASDGTENVERWMPAEDGVLRGESTTRAGGQVVHTESLRIAQGEIGLEYRAEPQDQPANVFRLEGCGSTWARFVDSDHDWPQSIHYMRTDDLMRAIVSGTEKGEKRTETWSWTLASSESVVSKQ